eukprot:1160734-Rhodomonas_salina.1
MVLPGDARGYYRGPGQATTSLCVSATDRPSAARYEPTSVCYEPLHVQEWRHRYVLARGYGGTGIGYRHRVRLLCICLRRLASTDVGDNVTYYARTPLLSTPTARWSGSRYDLRYLLRAC